MKKTALCIGINDYPGTDRDLAGCVNDANDFSDLLGNQGFQVTKLIDHEATRARMIKAMNEIVREAESGDVVVITYSGHGTWRADTDGEEPDLRDEALCPHDFPTSGPLLDDDLFDIFAERHRRVRLVFLSDSCHSGSLAKMAPPLGAKQLSQVRFVAPGPYLHGEELTRARIAEKAPAKGLSRGTALLMSGCRDTEYSYDTSFDGRPNGAFTRVALDTLAKLDNGATYADWYAAIRLALPSADYPQTPQLMASHSQRAWPIFA